MHRSSDAVPKRRMPWIRSRFRSPIGGERRLHHRAAVVVEADADQHLVEPGLLADVDLRRRLIAPWPRDGDVPLVADRVVDEAALRRPPRGNRRSRRRNGGLVREVVGAVERVDHPEVLGAGVARVRPPRRGSRGRGRPGGSPRRSPARPRGRRRRRGWRRPCSASRRPRGSTRDDRAARAGRLLGDGQFRRLHPSHLDGDGCGDGPSHGAVLRKRKPEARVREGPWAARARVVARD